MPPRSLSSVSTNSTAYLTERSASPRPPHRVGGRPRRQRIKIVIHNHMPPPPVIPTRMPMVSVGIQTDAPTPPEPPAVGWKAKLKRFGSKAWRVARVVGQVCVSIALFFMPRINFGVGVRLDDLFFRPR